MSANTLSSLLRRSDRSPALVSPQGGELASHQQLAEVVLSLGAQLRSTGIGKGDVVALAFPDKPNAGQDEAASTAASFGMLACLLAIASIRAVAAPLDPSTSASHEATFEALQVMLLIVPSVSAQTPSLDLALTLAKSLKIKTLALPAPFPAAPASEPPKFAVLFDKYASQKGLGQRLFEQRGRGRDSLASDVAVASFKDGKVEGLAQKDLIESAQQIVSNSSLGCSDRGSLSGWPLWSTSSIVLCAAAFASGGSIALTGPGTWSALEGGGVVCRAAASMRALKQGRESKL